MWLNFFVQALGDIVESCIGAILLDTGFNLNHVWKTMLSFLDPVIHFSGLQLNPIRELQELSQSYNMELKFASSKKDNTYTVEIKVNGKDVCEHSSASNFSKKAAKRRAAKQLILILKVKFSCQSILTLFRTGTIVGFLLFSKVPAG